MDCSAKVVLAPVARRDDVRWSALSDDPRHFAEAIGRYVGRRRPASPGHLDSQFAALLRAIVRHGLADDAGGKVGQFFSCLRIATVLAVPPTANASKP